MYSLPMAPYLLTVVPALLAKIAKDKALPVKQVVASALYAVVLAVLASWSGEVTLAFAWLIAVTSLVINGVFLWNLIGRYS